MLVSPITPITAGQIRQGGYKNSFDRYIGIDAEGFTLNGAITVIPPETAKNVHGTVHGGYTASVLDTVASGIVCSPNQTSGLEGEEYPLTASLDVRYLRPLFVGREYRCEGKIVSREGNNIRTEAAITDDQGMKVATAKALVKARRIDYQKVSPN